MEHLVGVVQALSQARDVATVTRIARDAARELTGCDGSTFVLRDNGKCYYADENAIAPLWKGKRFPMEACISGWVMFNGVPATIEDIYADPRIPAEAYRPTFVKSLAMVPIRKADPIGAIGNYWAANHKPTDEEIKVLQALADTTSVALENVQLLENLQAQVETLEAQSARIKSQHDSLEVFAHALAHDLKEPVRTVRSFTDMIVADGDLPPENRTHFEFIQKAADRMGMLVDTVFLYTTLHNPECMEKRTCALDNVLQGACDNLRHLIDEHKAEIIASPLPVVQAHAGHMMQVLQNLIGNAIRHSQDGVRIEVSAVDAGITWCVRVRDNGPGIAPEDQARIFQPFKRLNQNEEGAGLGLSICTKIIAMHGGRLWCEDAPVRGADFYFTLPKAAVAVDTDDEDAALPTEETMATGSQDLARVLLVDDREADLELTRILLRDRDKFECNLATARSGVEALKLMKQAQDTGDIFDLILLDINMPGMDGFELLEAIRKDEALSDVAVVMCTGSTYDKDQERAQTLGAKGYMVKPPSLDQLRPMVEGIPELSLEKDGPASKLRRVA
jgi:signal transduction histidine kinase/ActR/RegA family two-component response regulator